MDRKFQVFVSSTYEDLKTERQAVVRAVLEMGHIPVGMEMFSAADDEQWEIIRSHIDQSDYYVVIVAHRYGTTERGVSYTEKEYAYALSCGIPILGFLLADHAAWDPTKIDSDQKAKARLKRFRERVKKKPVSFWASADELRAAVSMALMKQINTHPRPGWIRGDKGATAETANELSRLSRENAELRERLGRVVAPHFEISGANLAYQEKTDRWVGQIWIIGQIGSDGPVTIPWYHLSLSAQTESATFKCDDPSFLSHRDPGVSVVSKSHIFLKGGGSFRVAGVLKTPLASFATANTVTISATFRLMGSPEDLRFSVELRETSPASRHRHWSYVRKNEDSLGGESPLNEPDEPSDFVP